MFKVTALSKSFSNKKVLSEISFGIQPGQIYSLLGINGAGKTTTFRSLIGLLPVDSGSIELDGENILSSETTKLFGFVPDKYSQVEYLTLEEHLLFVAGNYAISGVEARNKANFLIEEFKLSEHREKTISNLSHGMRQRLSLACALVHSPKLLIIDEPLVGLDPASAELLIKLLKKYAANGMAIIFSTHLLNVVERLSTHVLLLHYGKILLDASITDLNTQLQEKDSDLSTMFTELTTHQAVW